MAATPDRVWLAIAGLLVLAAGWLAVHVKPPLSSAAFSVSFD